MLHSYVEKKPDFLYNSTFFFCFLGITCVFVVSKDWISKISANCGEWFTCLCEQVGSWEMVIVH